MQATLVYTFMPSPIGQLLLAGDGQCLRLLGFPEGKGRIDVQSGWRETAAPFNEARRQLEAYFAGSATSFDLPLDPIGTPFQRRVWQELLTIPYGTTTTYRTIAARIGRPSAIRATGAANGRNPIPIIIPCHRVVGADGSLTGFGGGLPAKQWLLELEGKDFAPFKRQSW